MSVKYVFEVKTTIDGAKVWSSFNVAAKDFEQAVKRANEEIAADVTPEDDYEETIISVTRGVALGRERE